MSNREMSNPGKTSAAAATFAFTHHVRDYCLCLHVQRAARALARRFDDALRPVGLTQGQFSLLTSLNRAEPPTIGAVATLLALDRTTLTANLKPLERRGLVKVKVDREDKRSRRLIMTPAGRRGSRRRGADLETRARTGGAAVAQRQSRYPARRSARALLTSRASWRRSRCCRGVNAFAAFWIAADHVISAHLSARA